jgi:hypothetical protein
MKRFPRRRFGYLVDPSGRLSATADHPVDHLGEEFVAAATCRIAGEE